MRFTKRERWLGNVAGWTLMGAIIIAILGFASGCSSQATTVEARAEEVTGYVAAMEAAGLKGRAVLIWGGGHVAGQAFNLSGSSGFVEIKFGSDGDE